MCSLADCKHTRPQSANDCSWLYPFARERATSFDDSCASIELDGATGSRQCFARAKLAKSQPTTAAPIASQASEAAPVVQIEASASAARMRLTANTRP